jgi:hypothetical protein
LDADDLLDEVVGCPDVLGKIRTWIPLMKLIWPTPQTVLEDDTNLGRRQTLLGELEDLILEDLILDILGGQLQTCGNCLMVGEGRLEICFAMGFY